MKKFCQHLNNSLGWALGIYGFFTSTGERFTDSGGNIFKVRGSTNA